MMQKSFFIIVFAWASMGGPMPAGAVPRYSIKQLGLSGDGYVRDDGSFVSTGLQLNSAGQVTGSSTRYRGSNNLGQSVWLYDGTNTFPIGLADQAHTRLDGYQQPTTTLINSAGQAAGSATRYNGGPGSLGSSVWLFDGVNTSNVGLMGAEYVRDEGRMSASLRGLNEAGVVIGTSERFQGDDELGKSAWLHRGGTTIDIGLADNEHSRSNGFRWSDINQTNSFNQHGQVVGYSERYDANNFHIGATAWIYDGATNRKIGLKGPEFTSSRGWNVNQPSALNENGQVVGSTTRYLGRLDSVGQSAWFFDGNSTVEIGLLGPEYVRNDGYRYSNASQLTDNGLARGGSERFGSGGLSLGVDSWLYDGATTFNIGLIGPDHTRNDGYRKSTSWLISEAGQVLGESDRFMGGQSSMGKSVWIYDGSSTLEIGLVDGETVRADGYRANTRFSLNESGMVGGQAERYFSDGRLAGQDAWIYDPTSKKTIPLRLSARDDGYAYSQLLYVGDDGLALGIYSLFDNENNDLGSRVFYFTPADGMHDLDSLVDGGLFTYGLEALINVRYANKAGQILGTGRSMALNGQAAFLLTPIVPEPSCLASWLIGAMLLQFRRRR